MNCRVLSLFWLPLLAVFFVMSSHAIGAEPKATTNNLSTISPATLAGLVWSMTTECDDVTGIEKQQCLIFRDARRNQITGQTYKVRGDDLSVVTADYDSDTKTIPLRVLPCVACDTPLEVEGKQFVVVAQPVVAAGTQSTVTTPNTVLPNTKDQSSAYADVVAQTTVRMPDAEFATKWQQYVAPRLVSEFVVHATPAGSRSKLSNSKNIPSKISWELLSYQVYDPCNGDIVAASAGRSEMKPDTGTSSTSPVDSTPSVLTATIDRTKCTDNDPKVKVVETIVKPAKPALPSRLSMAQIRNGMAPLRIVAKTCYGYYGVEGNAKIRVVIGSDGTIRSAKAVEEFADTPTGECLEQAASTLTFPKTKKPKTIIRYPVLVSP